MKIKICWGVNIFGGQQFLVKILGGGQNNLGFNNFFGLKYLGVNIFWAHYFQGSNFIGSKKTFGQHFWLANFLGVNIFKGPNFTRLEIFNF